MAVRFVVHGRVQGVYFRASTQVEAQKLGLVGWVRNRRDGTVEGCVDGEKTEQLITWLHEGPPLARVTQVERSEVPPLQTNHFCIER